MTRRQGRGWDLFTGDARAILASSVLVKPASVAAVVTSPPYFGQRDYGAGDQEIGTIAQGLKRYLADVTDTVNATIPKLTRHAVVWLNVQDTYNAYNRNRGPGGKLAQRRDEQRATQEHVGLMVPGVPNKSLLGIPARLTVALLDAGWTVRSDITWHKAAMPERVRDRPARTTERLLMLTRTDRYGHPDPMTIPPTTRTDVWHLPTAAGVDAHSARFSVELASACLAWSPTGPVLDPFSGSASTGVAALRTGRPYVGIDLYDPSNEQAAERLANTPHPV